MLSRLRFPLSRILPSVHMRAPRPAGYATSTTTNANPHTSTDPVPETATTETEAETNTTKEEPKESLEKQHAQLKDLYLRSLADVQNTITRGKREQQSAREFAIQQFAKDIISIADTLEIAMANIPKENENEKKGLELTSNELKKIFAKHGVTDFETSDQPYDCNNMMALFEVDATEGKTPGTVASTLKKGYSLNGRILRAAQVSVYKDE